MFFEDEYLPSAFFLRYIPNLQSLDLSNYTPQRMKNFMSGIEEIHNAGVSHGDPTPRNMMVITDDPERVVWMDFDRAKTLEGGHITEWQKRHLQDDKDLADGVRISLEADYARGEMGSFKSLS